MPDVTTQTTEQLLDAIHGDIPFAHIATWNELKARIIKDGDSDSDAQHKGGIRPEHAPRV